MLLEKVRPGSAGLGGMNGLGQIDGLSADIDRLAAFQIDDEFLDHRQVAHLDVSLHVAQGDARLRVVGIIDLHAVGLATVCAGGPAAASTTTR